MLVMSKRCTTFVRMPGSRPDPQQIRLNIERATARRDAALVELEAASRELLWWRAGQEMFDPEGAMAAGAEEAADATIKEILPQGLDTPEPTLRQTMLLAMRADPHGDWPTSRIHEMLVMHGWIDPDAKDQSKRITDMAALMAQDELLERPSRGIY